MKVGGDRKEEGNKVKRKNQDDQSVLQSKFTSKRFKVAHRAKAIHPWGAKIKGTMENRDVPTEAKVSKIPQKKTERLGKKKGTKKKSKEEKRRWSGARWEGGGRTRRPDKAGGGETYMG